MGCLTDFILKDIWFCLFVCLFLPHNIEQPTYACAADLTNHLFYRPKCLNLIHNQLSILTHSLSWCQLKMTNKSAKSQTLKFFVFFFALACESIFVKMHNNESRLLQDWKIHCLQVCQCIFQPRNFTGWGSEGVNAKSLISSFYFDLFYSLARTHFEKACCFFKYSTAFSACPWSRTWSFCFFPRCFYYDWKTGVKYLIHSVLYLWSFPGFCCAYIIFISENLSDYIRGVEM